MKLEEAVDRHISDPFEWLHVHGHLKELKPHNAKVPLLMRQLIFLFLLTEYKSSLKAFLQIKLSSINRFCLQLPCHINGQWHIQQFQS